MKTPRREQDPPYKPAFSTSTTRTVTPRFTARRTPTAPFNRQTVKHIRIGSIPGAIYDARHSCVNTAVGLGAGVALDFGSIGVTELPVQLVLHRTALIVAFGLFAFGVARRDRWSVGAGSTAWTLTLAAPLAGVVRVVL